MRVPRIDVTSGGSCLLVTFPFSFQVVTFPKTVNKTSYDQAKLIASLASFYYAIKTRCLPFWFIRFRGVSSLVVTCSETATIASYSQTLT